MSTSHPADARAHPRYPVDGALEMSVGTRKISCQPNDISISAVSVTTDQAPSAGDTVVIEVPGIGQVQARVGRVHDGRVVLTLDNEAQVQSSGVGALARALG